MEEITIQLKVGQKLTVELPGKLPGRQWQVEMQAGQKGKEITSEVVIVNQVSGSARGIFHEQTGIAE